MDGEGIVFDYVAKVEVGNVPSGCLQIKYNKMRHNTR